MWAFLQETFSPSYGLVGDNSIHDLILLFQGRRFSLDFLRGADRLHIVSARNGQTHTNCRDTLTRTIGKALPFQMDRLPSLRLSRSDLWRRRCHGAKAQCGQCTMLRLQLPFLHHLQFTKGDRQTSFHLEGVQ